MLKRLVLSGIIFVIFTFIFYSQNFISEKWGAISRLVFLASLLAEPGQGTNEVGVGESDFNLRYESTSSLPFDFSDWERPSGPPRVGLQAGHWKNNELPDEFERLRERGGGSSGGGKAEWEVNLKIAEKTASLLEDQGIIVDVLPATIPVAYWADVFVAIHADGSEDLSASGFKAASAYGCFGLNRPATSSISNFGWGRRHESAPGQWVFHLRGSCPQDTKALRLVELLEGEYRKTTDLDIDSNVSRNMRGYYAFNWRRYEHALHPMTTAAILEAGFLTSSHDRAILIKNPDKAAGGISNAIIQYLVENNLK